MDRVIHCEWFSISWEDAQADLLPLGGQLYQCHYCSAWALPERCKAEKGHFLGGPRWYLQLIPYVSWCIRLCHPSGNTRRPHQVWQTLLLHQQNESKSHVLDRCVLKQKPEMCLTKVSLTLLSTCKQKYPNKFRVDRGKPHLSLHVLQAFCIQETF